MKKLEAFNSIDEIREKLSGLKQKSIGFVPTMGYLHEGHASLIRKAKEENDIVVVSIFVNPIQFGPNEDYDTYPRDFDRDVEIMEKAGTDIVFLPTVEEMYPEKIEVFVDLESEMGEKLCGSRRPGHFRGVMTVVSKLLNIIQPDKAYFGQKDAQQVTIIEKMVSDLNFNVKIVRCPILREDDGLAMSSRNIYLSSEARKEATVLYKSLRTASQAVLNGNKDVSLLKKIVKDEIEKSEIADIEYIEILDYRNLSEIDVIKDKALLALAVRFGNTRLIDNCILEG
jgi:pantoate--beta-alanine ligase